MKGEIEVGNIEFHDDGQNLIVKVEIRNTSDRTLHAYASVRGLKYDSATKALTVLLTDRGLAEKPHVSNFNRPRFTSVDPKGQTVISLSLPRFLTRMAASEREYEPKIETLPIHEATTMRVEVAWSDKPFYPDPRDKRNSMRAQLVEWERGIAKGEWRRSYKNLKKE